MHPTLALFTIGCGLAAPLAAASVLPPRVHSLHARAAAQGVAVTDALLLKFAPSINTCDPPHRPDECVSAGRAAPLIQASFDYFQIKEPAEYAALLALMSVESEDFHYRTRAVHSDDTAGQGTANMQQYQFTSEYAEHVLPAEVQEITGSGGAGIGAAQKDQVLALVTPDEYNFGSAAWYYANKCTADVKNAVKSGSDAGYTAYIQTCVGTAPSPQRLQRFHDAKAALGI